MKVEFNWWSAKLVNIFLHVDTAHLKGAVLELYKTNELIWSTESFMNKYQMYNIFCRVSNSGGVTIATSETVSTTKLVKLEQSSFKSL